MAHYFPFNQLFIQDIMNDVENQEINRHFRARRRIFRRNDAFQLPDHQFIKLFRLNKNTTRELINLVEPHLPPQTRRSALDTTTSVSILPYKYLDNNIVG